MKTLTFSNISVITEDIYLKLRVAVHYQKGEPIPVGEVILHFFLTKLCPFFNLEFSKCRCSRALAPAWGALVSKYNYVKRVLMFCIPYLFGCKMGFLLSRIITNN